VGQDSQQAAFMDSLGWLYYKRGKFEQARQWLSLGAKMQDGDDPVITDHLGDVEWRLGHPAEAVSAWKKALALHDRKIAEEHADRDEKFATAVKAKLAEAARNGKPAVATATAD
jgi:tetratricopeptide (TPR) repeat protein